MDISSVALFLFGIVLVAYLFIKKRYSYWSDRGIAFAKPIFPFGNIKGLGSTVHLREITTKYYNQLKNTGLYGGLYFFTSPAVLPLDLDFLKRILTTDFQYFMNRGIYYNEKSDPLSAHLVNVEGQYWKNLRTKLTPTFSSGKLKMMHPTIMAVADEFNAFIEKSLEISSEFEMHDILGRFTTDVIGSCAFGLECSSLKNPNTEFRVMGKSIFGNLKSHERIKQFFMMSFKSLARKLNMKVLKTEVSDFFMKVVKDTITYREKNNVQRNDFMSLLIQLKNNGKLYDDNSQNSENTVSLTVEEIAAQSLIFFFAGFETSSNAMTFSLYELSLNQEIQDKARKEIQDVIARYNGVLTYEAALELKYLDQIINETLRIYPVASTMSREVSKDYQVPGTDQVLEKGTSVVVPIYSIHHDPDIYDSPEVFNPDRFEPEEVNKRHPFSYIPFGGGPRTCIGLRFAMMQTRIGLATLLRNYKFSSCSKSTIPIKISTREPFLNPENGLWVKVEKI